MMKVKIKKLCQGQSYKEEVKGIFKQKAKQKKNGKKSKCECK